MLPDPLCQGIEIVGSTPAEFARVIASDLRLWTDLAVRLKVTAE